MQRLVVAFTGHRPHKLGGYGASSIQVLVRAELRRILEHIKPIAAISGMALGVDQWAAEVCNDLRIPWCAAVPFDGQQARWPEESRRKYALLLQTAVRVVLTSSGSYSPEKMQIRNEYMVDHADLLIAVWDGSSGGTANCVNYAQKQGKQVLRIDPQELQSETK